MPTLETRIEQSILKAFDDQAKSSNNPDDPSVSRKKIASAIAKAVVTEIKSATIIIVGTAGQVPLTIASVTIT
jgi:hypothetical protein